MSRRCTDDLPGQMQIEWTSRIRDESQRAPLTPQETPPSGKTSVPIQSRARRHATGRLPLPRPLPHAVAAGVFGRDERGKPICPGRHEVRAITERHTEKLIDMLDAAAASPASSRAALLESFQKRIAAYAEDFGASAAAQLEGYVRRQSTLDCNRRRDR